MTATHRTLYPTDRSVDHPRQRREDDLGRGALRLRNALTQVLSVIASVAVIAQGTQGSPAFEVVSVKANPARIGIRGHSFPGDRFEARNVPLKDLILVAYGEPGQLLPEAYVSSGLKWIDDDRFDVTASAGSVGPADIPRKQLMLRALLAERFHLVTHTEQRTLPMYALVPAVQGGALGPRLRRTDTACEALLAAQPGRGDGCMLSALPLGDLQFRGQTMKALAGVLAMLLERPVQDDTGLIGAFDGDAKFSPAGLPGMQQLPGNDSDVPVLSTAMQDQLGLKLVARRGPVTILVIDGAERPAAN